MFTSNTAKDLRHRDADCPWRNFCTPLEIFLSGDSESLLRYASDTAVLLRFLSEMEEDILSMRSRVFSHSHTIASDFHLYLFDIVLPVLKYQLVPLIPIFFSRNFRTVPLEYTLGWNNRNGNLYRFKVPFSQRSKHRES